MDSKKLIFCVPIVAIIFGNVYATQLQRDGGYNMKFTSREAFIHTINYRILNRLQSPLDWCVDNIASLIGYTPPNLETRQQICNDDTGVLSPLIFCKQFAPGAPAFSSFAPFNLDHEVGPPNMNDSHYYVDAGQISTSTLEETPMHTFMLTKEEEANTEALRPLDFCEQITPDAPAFSSSTSMNIDYEVEPPSMNYSHYYVDHGQTSTNTSNETPIYTFMATKEEEEEKDRINKKTKAT